MTKVPMPEGLPFDVHDKRHVNSLISWLLYGDDAHKYESPVSKLQKGNIHQTITLQDVKNTK